MAKKRSRTGGDDSEIQVLISPEGWAKVCPEPMDRDSPDLRADLLNIVQKQDEDDIAEFLRQNGIDGVIQRRKWRQQNRYKTVNRDDD